MRIAFWSSIDNGCRHSRLLLKKPSCNHLLPLFSYLRWAKNRKRQNSLNPALALFRRGIGRRSLHLPSESLATEQQAGLAATSFCRLCQRPHDTVALSIQMAAGKSTIGLETVAEAQLPPDVLYCSFCDAREDIYCYYSSLKEISSLQFDHLTSEHRTARWLPK